MDNENNNGGFEEEIRDLVQLDERENLRIERRKNREKQRPNEKSKIKIVLESRMVSRNLMRLLICSIIFVSLLLVKIMLPKYAVLSQGITFVKEKINTTRDINEIKNKAKEGINYINNKYNLNIERYIPALSNDVSEDTEGETKEPNETQNTDNFDQNNQENETKDEKKAAVAAISIIDNDINAIKALNMSFIKPISGTITSNFGARISDGGVVTPYHEGTDIANVKGTKVKSIMEGKVIYAKNLETGLGHAVKIQNGDVVAIYGHMDKFYVEEGQEIKQGQEIGEVGDTGAAKGYHLHLAITYQGRYVDAEKLIQF